MHEVRSWLARRAWVRLARTLSTFKQAVFGLWCAPSPNLVERGILVFLAQMISHSLAYSIHLLEARQRHGGAVRAVCRCHLVLLAIPLLLCLLSGGLMALLEAIEDVRAALAVVRDKAARAELVAEVHAYR